MYKCCKVAACCAALRWPFLFNIAPTSGADQTLTSALVWIRLQLCTKHNQWLVIRRIYCFEVCVSGDAAHINQESESRTGVCSAVETAPSLLCKVNSCGPEGGLSGWLQNNRSTQLPRLWGQTHCLFVFCVCKPPALSYGGTTLRFNYVWLRDHCLSEASYNSSTNQRNLDTGTIDLNIRPVDTKVQDGHLLLTCK